MSKSRHSGAPEAPLVSITKTSRAAWVRLLLFVLFVAAGLGLTLDLPSIPIVANPPPPGVYSGPRLAVFTHLLAPDGAFLVGDDGLWVDPLTLRPGDQFVQRHRFAVPVDAPDGPYSVELGLYDPKSGQRRSVLDAAGNPVADYVLIRGDQRSSPMP